MSTTTNVFITGATGYIGGAVLDRLLRHHTAPSSKFTALVRSPEKAQKLESIGVHTIIGSHSDLDKLEQLASESDIVFAIADCDDEPAARAILAGLKRRHEATGKVPILIHTSGTGVLIDRAAGDYSTDTIYDDTNVEQLESLPDTQIHRNVDLLVIDADRQGYARTHIILPSTIYALATGKLVDLGIQNRRSVQVPVLIKQGLNRGQGAMVGEGKNRWPNVHIDDIADLYIVLYDAALAGKAGHGREGLYFGENGEHLLYDVSKVIAQVLYELGKGKSPEPTSLTEQELKAEPMVIYLGTNSRCVANRGRAIGWKPKFTLQDLFDSIKPEVDAILEDGF